MIQRVYEQALKSQLDDVVVATDDVRIADAVMDFGGRYVMTNPNHQTGTDRCREAMELLGRQCDAVVNIQGDEPFIDPRQINQVVDLIRCDNTMLATLAIRISEENDLFSPNTVKVVMDNNGKALYFSRHPIPFIHNLDRKRWFNHGIFYKHIGIYAYKATTLKEIATIAPSALEQAESLEQLRWLQNGFQIHIGITSLENVSIDQPKDIEKAEQFADNKQMSPND